MLRRSTLTRTVHRLLLAATLVVCLAPLRAQDAAARAITLIGDVSFLRDGPNGYKWALNQGQDVKPGWIIKTGKDGYVKFLVSDGSTFEVFADTEATFRQDPGNWTHLLNLWIGHIKVIIQHLPGVSNPNNVTSPTAVISVRGTIFDVIVEDLDGTTLVSVDEGLVQVHHRIRPGQDKFLSKGEAVRVLPNEPLAKAADHGFMAKGARVVEQALYEIMRQRSIGGGPGQGGTAPTTTGAQGDKGKTGGSTGSGGTPAPPGGTAPAPPGGSAPAPPGGAPPPPPPAPGGPGG